MLAQFMVMRVMGDTQVRGAPHGHCNRRKWLVRTMDSSLLSLSAVIKCRTMGSEHHLSQEQIPFGLSSAAGYVE